MARAQRDDIPRRQVLTNGRDRRRRPNRIDLQERPGGVETNVDVFVIEQRAQRFDRLSRAQLGFDRSELFVHFHTLRSLLRWFALARPQAPEARREARVRIDQIVDAHRVVGFGAHFRIPYLRNISIPIARCF